MSRPWTCHEDPTAEGRHTHIPVGQCSGSLEGSEDAAPLGGGKEREEGVHRTPQQRSRVCKEQGHLRNAKGGFPGSPVIKNLPCNARDTSCIPALGRSHMPQSN